MIYLLLLLSQLFCNTFYIPNDYNSIQSGINNASSGDTIIVNPGIYFENITIDNKVLFIMSANGPDSTIIDGSPNYSPVISFNNIMDSPIEISGFTIQNGTGEFIENSSFGGGILSKNSVSRLTELIIKNNNAFAGGGICYYSQNLINDISFISNSIINNNLASEGGGIFAVNHNININATNIENNGMDLFGSGGGIQILLSNFYINHTIISNNETRFGGGIYISNSNGVLYNTTISNNYSDSKGGGLWIGGDSTIDLNKLLISNNQSIGFGGGAFISNSNLNIINSTIVENIISPNVLGAGLYMDGGNAEIINSIIYYNRQENSEDTMYNLGGYSADNFIEYNITYSNIEGENNWIPNGVGNLSTSPLFVDLTNDDYHLLYNSPCIDAGSPDYIDPDTTVSDMGAFYYNQNISGDLNDDNEINILDIIIIINLILNNTYNSLADMNFDSIINVQDAIILINIILSI